MKVSKIIIALLLSLGVINQLPVTLSAFEQLFYNFNAWNLSQVIVAIGFIYLIIYLLKSSLYYRKVVGAEGTIPVHQHTSYSISDNTQYLYESRSSNDEILVEETINIKLIGLFSLVTILSAFFSCFLLGIALIIFKNQNLFSYSDFQSFADHDKALLVVVYPAFLLIGFFIDKSFEILGIKGLHSSLIYRFQSSNLVYRILFLIPFFAFYFFLMYIFIKAVL